MPTPLKSSGNMRKHLTKAERQARVSAEKKLQRSSRVVVPVPEWLEDEQARRIFESTKRRMKGLGLLDNLDTELLALYADAVVRYQKEFEVKEKQAWSRIALAYAEKLGISPSARARLAKKAAEKTEADPFEQLLDDATDTNNW